VALGNLAERLSGREWTYGDGDDRECSGNKRTGHARDTELLEHDDTDNQEAFEKSLETHNHQKLLARIQKRNSLKLSNRENAFLHVLTGFYENLRYDRFSLRSPLALGKEKHALFDCLEKHLKVTFNLAFSCLVPRITHLTTGERRTMHAANTPASCPETRLQVVVRCGHEKQALFLFYEIERNVGKTWINK